MIDRIKADATALAAAQAGNWQACADRLNAIAVGSPIRTLRGSGWLMTSLPSDAEAILAGFALAQQAASVGDSPLNAYYHRIQRTNSLLDTSGIDWSADALQSLLPVVAQVAGWSSELLAKVQAIGLPKPVVTAQECQDAWASENEASFDAWFNEFVSASLHDKTAAKSAIIANLEEW